jgi:hypothetical protein
MNASQKLSELLYELTNEMNSERGDVEHIDKALNHIVYAKIELDKHIAEKTGWKIAQD